MNTTIIGPPRDYTHMVFKILAASASGFAAESETLAPERKEENIVKEQEAETATTTREGIRAKDTEKEHIQKIKDSIVEQIEAKMKDKEVIKSMTMEELYPLRPKSDEVHLSYSEIKNHPDLYRIEKMNIPRNKKSNPHIRTYVDETGAVSIHINWGRKQTKYLMSHIDEGNTVLLHWGREGCYDDLNFSPGCLMNLNTHWLTRVAPIFNKQKVSNINHDHHNQEINDLLTQYAEAEGF